jgi:restriction endonuclease
MQNRGVTVTDWRDYQERVARLFRELGCSAEVGISVQGVRAAHEIDVWVVFERFGLKHRWIVECKRWKSPIPKEKVLALKSIVEDIGADKGILVAESDFQPGAINAANSTNILLTTFAKLQAQAESDIQSILLEKLERKGLALQSRTKGLCEWNETEQGARIMSTHAGVDFDGYINFDGYIRMTALLSILNSGFGSVRVEDFPVLVSIDDCDKPVCATNRKEFIEMAGKALESVHAWVAEQEIAKEKARQGRNEQT